MNMSQFQIESKIQEAIDAIWAALALAPEGRVDNLLSGAQELLVRALHGEYERVEDYVNNDLQEANEFLPEFIEDDDYEFSLDGDHESALASAGWGTDEDYGYCGTDY